MIPLLITIYCLGYFIFFTVVHYNKLLEAGFSSTIKELTPIFFISFAWPVITIYLLLLFILKFASLIVLNIYVTIQEVFSKIFNKNNKNNDKQKETKIEENKDEEEE